MTGEESKDKGIVSIIVALVGLLIIIIAAHSLFPTLMFYSIVVVLLVLIVTVTVYGVFGQRLIKFSKKRAMAKKHRVLAQEYFKKFDSLVDRFRDLINEDHRDTIPFILRQLENGNTKYVNILPNPQNFKSAVDVCDGAMGKLPVTKDNFLILVGWFESIVNLCNEHLIRKPIEEIRRRGVDGIPEHISEDYERCEVIYDRFLDDYMNFAKDMNKQFAEKVARDYFEVPKGLRK
ncbi:MAG: hypothetical protein A2Z38_10875 [Planctomycetes bacterium RBG_19FT_COMBO_48_8]|nr:MAG: hypothetical protein A2Z38_10875 [Planctomycetes bacterium RBG_19FT_COMBO_48_8]